jgi:hypothetical protein
VTEDPATRVRTITSVVEYSAGCGFDIDATQVVLAGAAEVVVRRGAGGAVVAVAVVRGLGACVVCALDVAVGMADVERALALLDADSTVGAVLRIGCVLLQAAMAVRVITASEAASAAAAVLRLPLHTRPQHPRATAASAITDPTTCRAGSASTSSNTKSRLSSPPDGWSSCEYLASGLDKPEQTAGVTQPAGETFGCLMSRPAGDVRRLRFCSRGRAADRAICRLSHRLLTVTSSLCVAARRLRPGHRPRRATPGRHRRGRVLLDREH